MSRTPLSQRRNPQVGMLNGLRRMARGSASGQVAQASPARSRVQATVLPAPAPAGGGGTTALDYVEFVNYTGIAVASNDSEDLAWSDSNIVDSSVGGSRPAWLSYEFGTNLALLAGLYHVTVSGWINANIGSERISMSVLNNTTTSTPQGTYETGIAAGSGSYAQGSVALMIAVAVDDHSFYVRFKSDTLASSRTCKATLSIIRLGDVT